MKRNRKHQLATLAILIGMGAITVSCNKEKAKPNRKAHMIAVPDISKGGDEDDEDPIIQGKVKKPNLSAVDNALVETMQYSSNAVIDSTYTDSYGDFTQKVSPGIYYFRITPPGSGAVLTDTVSVNRNTLVSITVS